MLILVNKIYQPIMGHVHDEQLTLFYFILLTLLAASYDLLLTLQLFIVTFFDVLFDSYPVNALYMLRSVVL